MQKRVFEGLLKKILLSTAVLSGILAQTSAVFAEDAKEPGIVWSEEFDSETGSAGATVYYEGWKSGKSKPELLIKEINNGICRYGIKFDEGGMDRVNMIWGETVWWPTPVSEWGPYDVKKYNLEISWRGARFSLDYAIEDSSGKITPAYSWVGSSWDTVEKVTSTGNWHVSTLSFAKIPNAVNLKGINICHYMMPGKPEVVTEIDYIRLVPATNQSSMQDDILKDYKIPEWPKAAVFFPFGVFGTGFLDMIGFEYWGGSYQGAYGQLARHHLNFLNEDYEDMFGRNGGGVDSFIKTVKGKIALAKENGLFYSADIRYIMGDLKIEDGYKQLSSRVKPICDAFKGEETLVSWFLKDEPTIVDSYKCMAVKRAIEEFDTDHRPVTMIINNPGVTKVFAPYLTVNFWDNYPILRNRRAPWMLRKDARAHREILPDKPMWGLLQAFAEGVAADSITYPNAAEIKLMSYLSLAEGAKGLTYFTWFFSSGAGAGGGMAYRTGKPRPITYTISEIGSKLIPVSQLLLETDPVALNVNISDDNAPIDGHGLTASVLKHRKRDVYYLVVINEDVTQARSGKLNIPSEISGKGNTLYDLYNLESTDSGKIKSLSVGDGRIYAVGPQKDIEQDRKHVMTRQAMESVRVLMPDIGIARRWGLELAEIDAAVAACHKACSSLMADEALAQSGKVSKLVAQIMDKDELLKSCRSGLEKLSDGLSELQSSAETFDYAPKWWTKDAHPAYTPNKEYLTESKEYWRIGRIYSDLYTRYLAGKRDGLQEPLEKALADFAVLKPKFAALTAHK